MSSKLQEWMPMIIAVLTPVLTFVVEGQNIVYKYIVIGILAVFAIALFIYNRARVSKNLSNTSVIDKSRKYTKFLKKIVKANKKSLKKYYNKNELAEMRNKIDVVTKKIKGSYKDNKKEEVQKLITEKDKLLDKYYSKSDEYVSTEMIDASKSVLKIAKIGNYEESKKIFDLLYDTIRDIERILLQLEQHDLRIKLGKFIVKYSTDIDKTIRAYVDYIGWSNVLLGNNAKGFSAIQEGLNLIDYKLKTAYDGFIKYYELKDKGYDSMIPSKVVQAREDYCKYALQKARALRHFGTTYYTYRSHNDNFVKKIVNSHSDWSYNTNVNPFVKEQLNEALNLMEDSRIKKYFEQNKDCRKEYDKMVFGLKYNDILYDFYEALNKNDNSVETFEELNNKLDKLEKQISICGFEDNHRLIKILTLKNQLKHKIITNSSFDNGIDEKKKYIDLWHKSLSTDLKTIENVLNKNIYFDEAMEVYVCQKIKKLYYDIENIFENK